MVVPRPIEIWMPAVTLEGQGTISRRLDQ